MRLRRDSLVYVARSIGELVINHRFQQQKKEKTTTNKQKTNRQTRNKTRKKDTRQRFQKKDSYILRSARFLSKIKG